MLSGLFLKLFHSEMSEYNCLYNGIRIFLFPFLCLSVPVTQIAFTQSKNMQIPARLTFSRHSVNLSKIYQNLCQLTFFANWRLRRHRIYTQHSKDSENCWKFHNCMCDEVYIACLSFAKNDSNELHGTCYCVSGWNYTFAILK